MTGPHNAWHLSSSTAMSAANSLLTRVGNETTAASWRAHAWIPTILDLKYQFHEILCRITLRDYRCYVMHSETFVCQWLSVSTQPNNAITTPGQLWLFTAIIDSHYGLDINSRSHGKVTRQFYVHGRKARCVIPPQRDGSTLIVCSSQTRAWRYGTVRPSTRYIDLYSNAQILLGERAHLIEFPSVLLPSGVTTGSIVNIAVHQNVAEERKRDQEFWGLQWDILETFGRASPEPPQLEVLSLPLSSETLAHTSRRSAMSRRLR